MLGTGSKSEPFYPLKPTNGVTDGRTRAPMFRLGRLKDRADRRRCRFVGLADQAARTRKDQRALCERRGARVDYGLVKKQLDLGANMFSESVRLGARPDLEQPRSGEAAVLNSSGSARARREGRARVPR
jgi:hypothetical protein